MSSLCQIASRNASSTSFASSLSVFSPDLGFSRWETVAFQESTAEFDIYFARPRGREIPCAFLLKALKPELCATRFGAAVVERERFFGTLPFSQLPPAFDNVRPGRVSATKARRGCVVVPFLRGRTLAERLDSAETFDESALASIETQLRKAILSVRRVGWSLGELTAERIFLADSSSSEKSPIVFIRDYSAARRFGTPSLFSVDSAFPAFDPDFELAPDVFFDPNATIDRDLSALDRLLRQLGAPTRRNASRFESLARAA